MSGTNLTIVCYHGVVEYVPDGYNSSGKHMLLSEFEKQISFLASHLEIVTMRDIEIAAQGLQSLPPECVAITFDDGFLNNLEVAHPILQKYGVPATIYVATNFISMPRLIWTDELEILFLEASSRTLTNNLNGDIAIDLSNRESRYRTLKSVKKTLKAYPPSKREALMAMLKVTLEIEAKEVRKPSLHNFLEWEHLKYMQNSGLWEVGAHTLNHDSLGTISNNDIKSEIIGSILKVSQEIGGRHTPLFSYPEGQEGDIPSLAIDTLKDLGLNSAPSAIYGKNQLPFKCSSEYFKLRRCMVGFEGLIFPWRMF